MCPYCGQLPGLPCPCAVAVASPTLGGLGEWLQDTDATPQFNCADKGAVASYLVRAKWTHGLRGGLLGFALGGIVAALLITNKRIFDRVRDRAVDNAVDRYLPPSRRRR